MEGPKESAYEGCLLHLRIEFPHDYPFKPPKFKFVHRMFHPSIYTKRPYDGQFSPSDIGTGEEWSPGLSVATILTNIYEILENENVKYLTTYLEGGLSLPMNHEAADLFRKNYDEWRMKVYETLQSSGVTRISMPNWMMEKRFAVLFCLQSATEKSVTLVFSDEAAADMSPHNSLTAGSGKVADSASKHESAGSGEAADASSPRRSPATSATRVYRTRNSSGVRYLLCWIARYT